ncbi:hypothetical protein D1823_18910 (plasmid) [Ruegeria sp. AD91A]|uniref:hypothetical protein n=1 Tax=Ruegeria sp. AD91A TaxID=2293862 RepID=UPI000E48A9CB|nr:hypothetical protein [Ruegeria sp. AD91A]AXT28792.1 hypothetical protein D1823_18910 [Ruegeria sp. AD91A]
MADHHSYAVTFADMGDPASRLKQNGWNVWPFFVPPFLMGTVPFPLPVSPRNRMGGASARSAR